MPPPPEICAGFTPGLSVQPFCGYTFNYPGTGVPIGENAAPGIPATLTDAIQLSSEQLTTLATCGSDFGLIFTGFVTVPESANYTFTLGVGGNSAIVTIGGVTFTNVAKTGTLDGNFPGAINDQFTAELPARTTPITLEYVSGPITPGTNPTPQVALQASGPGFPANGNELAYVSGYQ